MDLVTFGLAKKMISSVASGIESIDNVGTSLVFTTKEGQNFNIEVPIPKDGVSIETIYIDDKHLFCKLSDGQIIDAGELPEIIINNDGDAGLDTVEKYSSLPENAKKDDIKYVLRSEEAPAEISENPLFISQTKEEPTVLKGKVLKLSSTMPEYQEEAMLELIEKYLQESTDDNGDPLEFDNYLGICLDDGYYQRLDVKITPCFFDDGSNPILSEISEYVDGIYLPCQKATCIYGIMFDFQESDMVEFTEDGWMTAWNIYLYGEVEFSVDMGFGPIEISAKPGQWIQLQSLMQDGSVIDMRVVLLDNVKIPELYTKESGCAFYGNSWNLEYTYLLKEMFDGLFSTTSQEVVCVETYKSSDQTTENIFTYLDESQNIILNKAPFYGEEFFNDLVRYYFEYKNGPYVSDSSGFEPCLKIYYLEDGDIENRKIILYLYSMPIASPISQLPEKDIIEGEMGGIVASESEKLYCICCNLEDWHSNTSNYVTTGYIYFFGSAELTSVLALPYQTSVEKGWYAIEILFSEDYDIIDYRLASIISPPKLFSKKYDKIVGKYDVRFETEAGEETNRAYNKLMNILHGSLLYGEAGKIHSAGFYVSDGTSWKNTIPASDA